MLRKLIKRSEPAIGVGSLVIFAVCCAVPAMIPLGAVMAVGVLGLAAISSRKPHSLPREDTSNEETEVQ
jgi:hypothetical protein